MGGPFPRGPVAHFYRSYRIDESGCWLWTGSLKANGYPIVSHGTKGQYPAHRLSLQLASGKMGDGLQACHTCDVRHCVNPAHLFWGTQADNLADMTTKGRGNIGERNHFAKLTDDQISAIRQSNEPALILARRYGVVRNYVYSIKRRKFWRHLP